MFLLPVIAVTGTVGGSDLATHTEFEGLDAGVGDVPLVAIVFTALLAGAPAGARGGASCNGAD